MFNLHFYNLGGDKFFIKFGKMVVANCFEEKIFTRNIEIKIKTTALFLFSA